jgi:hypothetical protein
MDTQAIQAIVDNEFAVPDGAELSQLMLDLEQHLASTDPVVRENSLEVLWQWGLADRYTDEQLRHLGDRMVSHLATDTDQRPPDAVFRRAFSALILGMVLILDQRYESGQVTGRAAFLDEETVLAWFATALEAFSREQDRRGFVPGKGWAHAIAHFADLLGDFARSSHLSAVQLERLLHAVAAKLKEPTPETHRFNEDERLSQLVIAVMRRNLLPDTAWQSWLESLGQLAEDRPWGDVLGLLECDTQGNHARINTRDFLRSLYFQLLIGSRSFRARYLPAMFAEPIRGREELLAGTVRALRQMDRTFYPPVSET